MKCSKCGQELTEDSKFCKNCGTSVKKGEKVNKSKDVKNQPLVGKGTKILAIIFFSVLALASIYSLLTTNDDLDVNQKTQTSSQPQPIRAEIKANITVQDGYIVIKNLNKYPWNPQKRLSGEVIVFKVNDTFEYLYRLRIFPKVEIKLHPTYFTKSDGTKFNLLTYRLKTLSISCKEGFGLFGY